MQSQYGTDKIKAIIVFSVGAAGLPTAKCELGGQFIGGGNAAPGLGSGRYLFQLSDGAIVLPGGTTASGDNDNNTAILVSQSGNGNPCQEYWIQFGPQASTTPGTYVVNAGQIEIDFGASGGTNPANGSVITVIFYDCYDGTNNVP